jgi:crossover junction endodeoxyribonuclease RuvC
MVKIIGIDPSFTGTGICVSDGRRMLVKTYPEETTASRIVGIWDIIHDIILKTKDEVVVAIEGFSFMSKGRTIGNMYGLGWYIRCRLSEEGIKYYEIPPNSWKKILLRSKFRKGMGKDHMLLETYKLYDEYFEDNNMCDAFNIMKTGELVHNASNENFDFSTLTKTEHDVIKKLIS